MAKFITTIAQRASDDRGADDEGWVFEGLFRRLEKAAHSEAYESDETMAQDLASAHRELQALYERLAILGWAYRGEMSETGLDASSYMIDFIEELRQRAGEAAETIAGYAPGPGDGSPNP